MSDHVPPPDDGWTLHDPETLAIDPDALDEAVAYARLHDTSPDQVAYDFSNTHPWDESEGELGHALGPMPDRRGSGAGVILRQGRPVAEWGDTLRVDHTFSVAKSFLSIVAGLAWDRDLIEDVHDPVGEYVDDGGFGGRNAAITWQHFLQGTSEWEGTLFDRPDSVDRNRPVGRDADELGEQGDRELRDPGEYWEYNDVRINRLALSLLRIWNKPLPRVLAHEVMDPIGASSRWEWHGYYNSDVLVDGTRMKSVSGGGHWGGGVWIPARDLARVGHLLLSGGEWGGNQLLSNEWLNLATDPCPENPNYGSLLWLNTDRELWPSAPASSFAALGHGRNVVWVDPEHDLVAVLRWLSSEEDEDGRAPLDAFLARLLDAVE